MAADGRNSRKNKNIRIAMMGVEMRSNESIGRRTTKKMNRIQNHATVLRLDFKIQQWPIRSEK
jgi:hypothetical protein